MRFLLDSRWLLQHPKSGQSRRQSWRLGGFWLTILAIRAFGLWSLGLRATEYWVRVLRKGCGVWEVGHLGCGLVGAVNR